AMADLKWVDCDKIATSAKSLDCDFANNTCNWHSYFTDRKNDFQWTRTDTNSWRTDNDIKDHTTGGAGYFLLAQGQLYASDTKTAVIRTLPQEPARKCLRFWYRMFGLHKYKLEIVLIEHINNTKTQEKRLWVKSKSVSNSWVEGRVNFGSDKKFSLAIEATFAGRQDNKPKIALDDITVTDGDCEPTLTCDFESNFCDWDPQGKWIRAGAEWRSSNGKYPRIDVSYEEEWGHYAVPSPGETLAEL